MKKMDMLSRMTLFFCGMLLLTGNAFSQGKLKAEAITTDWSLFQEVKGIKFYAKKEIHTNEGPLNVEYVIVKLENTTGKEVAVTYSLAVHTNLGCNGCNSTEYYKTLTVPANSSIEGNPSKERSPMAELLVNHNLKDGWIPQYISTENLVIK